MSNGLRMVVLLELSDDVRVPPQRHPRSGRVRASWQVRQVDPAAARALDVALASRAGAREALALHLGPEEHESCLRDALARGCNQALRVWDEECAAARTQGKAMILAAAARVSGFDLLLAGTASAAGAGGQVGVLAAAHLGVPCVTQAIDLEVLPAGVVRVTRALAGGFREVVEVDLPAVVTVAAAETQARLASLPALLEAQRQDIPVWSLAELGVPREHVRQADRPLRPRPPAAPRPAVHSAPVPDSALPAFERILGLVQGSVTRRAGRVVRGEPDDLAEQIFEALRDEGWLDDLRGEGAGTEGPGGGSPE
ncbi:MAG: hypothetical protein M5U22_17280 [Thermoleophilia bacterium]|nr:hypothetical protein [Thermoleophilia bacterium]